MLTSVSYINEDKDFINFIEYVESVDNDIHKSMVKLDLIRKEAGVKLFFESSTKEEYMLFCEEENQSVLSKIGNHIMEMIKKFLDFFKGIFEKFKELFNDVESDKKTVEKMIQQNPAIGKEVVTGLKNEWFTYGDVAKYNKDMMGLYDMLIEKRIEHESVNEKISNIEYEYKEKESNFLKTVHTVQTIVGTIGFIVGTIETINKCNKGLHKFNDFLKSKGIDVKQTIDNVAANSETKVAESTEKIVSKLVSFNADISRRTTAAMGSIRSTLKGVINKGNANKP